MELFVVRAEKGHGSHWTYCASQRVSTWCSRGPEAAVRWKLFQFCGSVWSSRGTCIDVQVRSPLKFILDGLRVIMRCSFAWRVYSCTGMSTVYWTNTVGCIYCSKKLSENPAGGSYDTSFQSCSEGEPVVSSKSLYPWFLSRNLVNIVLVFFLHSGCTFPLSRSLAPISTYFSFLFFALLRGILWHELCEGFDY